MPALAGVGVVCGYRALIGIDVDSLDEEVQQYVLGALPPAPRRIGDPAKLGMLIYRYADSLSPPNQKFLAADGKGHVLEILGAGSQFVVGPTIHEKSGQPYHMADGGDLPPWDDLPWLWRANLEHLLRAIAPFCKSKPVLKDDEALEERDIEPFRATGNFDRDLTTYALANMAWVRPLFGDAARPTSGGYDVPSAALGRPLEERLSIHRLGIKDWGTYDLGDPREGRRTAVEVVMEWAGRFEVTLDGAPIVTRDQAVEWLCRQFGSTRSDLMTQWWAESEEHRASLWSHNLELSAKYFEEPAPDPLAQGKKRAEGEPEFYIVGGDVEPPPAKQVIKGIMTEESIFCIGGQSGAGKTFVTLDMLLALATGQDFLGHKIKKQMGGLYIAYEGFGSISKRFTAARKQRGIGRAPVHYMKGTERLSSREGAVALVESVRRQKAAMREDFGVELGIIVLDTLGQAFSMQDENNAAEVNNLLFTLKALREATGCIIAVVHHYGKSEGAGLRGSSAFRGGFDEILAVLADRNESTGAVSNRRIAISKGRDDEEKPLCGFRLHEHILGVDEDNDVIKSCSIAIETPKVTKPKEKRTEAEKAVLQAFHDVAKDGKQTADADGVIGVTVDYDTVRARFMEIYQAGGDTQKKRDHNKKVQFDRGIKTVLEKRDLVFCNKAGKDTLRGEI